MIKTTVAVQNEFILPVYEFEKLVGELFSELYELFTLPKTVIGNSFAGQVFTLLISDPNMSNAMGKTIKKGHAGENAG